MYMVASASTPIRVRVTRDGGQALGAERGADVGEDGWTTIHEERLYKPVEGKDYKTHSLEITIEGTGVTAYTLTFG